MAEALNVEGIAKCFGTTPAVKGLSFEVRRGEVYGLIGPDGSGKTTAMRMISGLLKPDFGQIRIGDFSLPKQLSEIRRCLGYMPQQYSLYGDLSVLENLRFFAGMYGVPSKARKERERKLLALSRLDEFTGRPAAALSGGMYKKLALACALIHQPDLLLLDEPTNGVDPISRRELWAFLRERVKEGLAVLVSTPYMDEAERCDHVGLMLDGTLAAEGSPAVLRRNFSQTVFDVVANDQRKARELLSDAENVTRVYSVGATLHVVSQKGALREDDIRERLITNGLTLQRAVEVDPSFEDIFLSFVPTKQSVKSHGQ